MSIFFGVIAAVIGLFVALLMIAMVVRVGEAFNTAMHENPPLALGASLIVLASSYLVGITVLSLMGGEEAEVLQSSYQALMLGGFGYHVGAGLAVLGVILAGLGVKLQLMMDT